MNIDRTRPPTARLKELSRKLDEIYGPCLACEDCTGICAALIDALMLPDVIVRPARR
ncbi:hypothetical protein LA6_000239 [Marinibacterium anthonyi]|nr:hypothetical protein LA6_000239 [Marinibacterium anthonyi]|tara:strand:- start:408 stop:578 length:171 start_codon:yes stop_codon:yes gene_type:complete